jgi:hypothetical protein
MALEDGKCWEWEMRAGRFPRRSNFEQGGQILKQGWMRRSKRL